MSAITYPAADGDYVGGTITVTADLGEVATTATLFTQEPGSTTFWSHGTVTLNPPTQYPSIQWDSTKAHDGTDLPDGSTVKLRFNGKSQATGTNIANAPLRTVVTQQGKTWDKKVETAPLNVRITALDNWLGAVFGAADVGPNSIDPAGTPAVMVLDRNDSRVPAGAPAYASRVVCLTGGSDPLRADARAEISDEMSGPTSPCPPYVDANGVAWYSPEWLTDRTNIDPRSAGQDGLEGYERWYYDAFAYDPARPPLPGYIISDQHAKYGVNFTINAGSTPGTLSFTIRGGEFEAVPDDPNKSGQQPLYKPSWATDMTDLRYTGYATLYSTAPSGGPYGAKWYKDASGVWKPVDANVGTAPQYDRRPGEWPNYYYDYVNHTPVYYKGMPGNGVPGIMYYQGYQRTFSNLGTLNPGWNTIERHSVWSVDKTKGLHQVWLNGQLILDVQGVPTLYHWVNNIGSADCHVGVASDVDGKNRSGYLTVYRQLQCYAAGQKAPDGSNVPDPPCRIFWAPYNMRTLPLITKPW